MSFASIAAKLGGLAAKGKKAGMKGYVKGRKAYRGMNKAASRAKRQQFYDMYRSGEMSRADALKGMRASKNVGASDTLSMMMQKGEQRLGVGAGESPIMSAITSQIPDTATGQILQQGMQTGFAKSTAHNLSQMASGAAARGIAGGIKNAPAAAAGLAKLPFKAAMLPTRIAGSAMTMPARMAARTGAAGGRMLSSAGATVNNEQSQILGDQISESGTKIAESFSAIAKNPINPQNWAKLATTVISLPGQFEKMGEKIVEVNSKLAPFSAALATATMQFQIDQLQRDIKSAQKTGGTASFMSNELSDLKDQLLPIQNDLTNLTNIVGGNLLEIFTELLKVFNFLYSTIKEAASSLATLTKFLIGPSWFKSLRQTVFFGLLDYDDSKPKQANDPLNQALRGMQDRFKGSKTMDRSGINNWNTTSSNTGSDSYDSYGNFNSPVDPNGDFNGLNDMG